MKRRLAPCLAAAIAVLAVVVYLPVRAHGFVGLDDPIYVRDNPHVQTGLTWENAKWAFTTGHAGNWHPLTWLSHMLDASLFDMDAGAHHVVNVVLHVANALLLFDVLRRMTGATARAALVAALFALHPLHVESVAWIAERKDVLSTLFWFLTLEAYVAWTRAPTRTRYVLVVASLAAGLTAKQMLVTLPFTLLLLDWWPLRRWTDAASARRLVVEKLPLFALVAAACVVTFLVQRAGGSVADFETRPLVDRALNAPIACVVYVRKMLAPIDLAALYVHPRTIDARAAVAATAALAFVTFVAVRARRTRPWLLVGWLWFLGTLVPVLGLVQVGRQSMADRYTYVPLVGLFVVVAWGGAELVNAERRRAAAATLALAATAACAVLARRQVDVWKDDETLWRHAVAVDPDNPAARNNLGDLLCIDGRYDEALPQFREMLRTTSDPATAQNNIGYVLRRRGDVAGAETAFREALRLKPDLAETHDELAGVLLDTGRADEARVEFEAALRLDPSDDVARAGLARLAERR